MDLLGFKDSRVMVKALVTATKRTKNRLRENGPFFTFVKKGRVKSLEGESILLRSEKTGWFGWLPLEEVTIVHTPVFDKLEPKIDQTRLYNQ